MSARHNKLISHGKVLAILVIMSVPVLTAAQEAPPFELSEDLESTDQADTQNEGLQRTARTADTGIGEVGQRQTASDGPGIQDPLDRIASRINNRIENRIRNRIDRNYDPTANATSPYEAADTQTRAARISGPR